MRARTRKTDTILDDPGMAMSVLVLLLNGLLNYIPERDKLWLQVETMRLCNPETVGEVLLKLMHFCLKDETLGVLIGVDPESRFYPEAEKFADMLVRLCEHGDVQSGHFAQQSQKAGYATRLGEYNAETSMISSISFVLSGKNSDRIVEVVSRCATCYAFKARDQHVQGSLESCLSECQEQVDDKNWRTGMFNLAHVVERQQDSLKQIYHDAEIEAYSKFADHLIRLLKESAKSVEVLV